MAYSQTLGKVKLFLCPPCLLEIRMEQLENGPPANLSAGCRHPGQFRSRGRRVVSSCCSAGREKHGLSLGCVFPGR